MRNKLYLAVFITGMFYGCIKDNSVVSGTDDLPEWLNVKIEEFSEDKFYVFTCLYSYDWNNEKFYHFEIPLSSCAFCELYDNNGKKPFENDNEMFLDFIQNKTNKTLIWRREDN